ncbi:SEC-C metal-binding domain-containing protein [Corallincola platygyrae]|uniref:SEC-C metal-binding domain-containing protein n=1 Tax=Corallincola platygyrae TaxID=1193278 RepID=A0ABW4XL48_9GAMM
MEEVMRSESEVFSELEQICTSQGYIHAIAYFCFRDNTLGYSDEPSPDDLLEQYSTEKLIRSEISTLIGLMTKEEIDFTLPSPKALNDYIEKTEALLKEIHQCLMAPMMDSFKPENLKDKNFNPFTAGDALREPIFYGGESAYNFQYRDFSREKYKNDNDWFEQNKGYSVSEAINVIESIHQFQCEKLPIILQGMREKSPDEWTILPGFEFTIEEIKVFSDLDENLIKKVIDSFKLLETHDKSKFLSLSDFNISNAYPIIQSGDSYYLLQHYTLLEALYETPFFWFMEDTEYKNTGMENRGFFTEEFSAKRLESVFGKTRVYTNIDIFDKKGDKASEIDVLVVFADRAIVLQAKSKKLTIAARKGNDKCIKDDFKKGVQDAYDQGLSCSELLQDESYRLINQSGEDIKVSRVYKEIYILCVVSDHYPALSFQSRQFLKYKTTDIIQAPFIMDVFLLDVIAEFLESPLYFLSYINRRTLYSEKLHANQELAILSYHLKQNLWIEGEHSFVQLSDDISVDLDLAIMSRRENLSSNKTPDGILTKNKDKLLGKVIASIEHQENPVAVQLGFMILFMSGDTIDQISDGIDYLQKKAKSDGKHHDLTVSFKEGSTGLTIHLNNQSDEISGKRLQSHCETRKYTEKAESWLGLCLNPTTLEIKLATLLEYDWKRCAKMDEHVKSLPKPQRKINPKTIVKGRKIGRNEKCPCGSGKKYKKCCL